MTLLVVAFAGYTANGAYQDLAAAKRTERINVMTDKFIQASVMQAAERGLVAAGLGSTAPVDAAMLGRLNRLRARGDALWAAGIADARRLADGMPERASFVKAIDQLAMQYDLLKSTRDRADRTLETRVPEITVDEWLGFMTRFINDSVRFREKGFGDMRGDYEIARLNNTIKYRAWMLSEYAGLERGMLAFYVSARRAVPDAVVNQLRALRGVVESMARYLHDVGEAPEMDQRIVRALRGMDERFLGRFDETRAAVYQGAVKGDYTLTGREWFDHATDAIESILGVVAATSRVIEEKAQEAQTHSQTVFLLNLGLLGLTFIAAGVSVAKVIGTANDLFEAKERAEVTLHSIGDGVITTDADGMIEHLNPVAEELTGWSTSEAKGRPLTEIFTVIDGVTREAQIDPVRRCLQARCVVGLDSHTVLIRRDGQEFAIENSAAPIYDRNRDVVGAVMVFYDASKSRNMPHLLSYQATHDSLTGLVNRREFERRMAELMDNDKLDGNQHAFCYIDLDMFKVINETCSHAAGDKLLRVLSQLLKKQVRECDTLARLGGDEFGVLLQSCPIEPAQRIANELLQTLSDFRFVWDKKTFEITASIGLVPITPARGGATEILAQADAACYAAKEKGRNRVQIYRPGDGELARRHGEMQWVSRLTQALEQDRFRLYYQTVVPLTACETERLCYEVLLRLVGETGEIVPPSAFIPAAERFNLMPAIDRWVVQATFAAIAEYYGAMRHSPLPIYFVNVSGASLGDDQFSDYVHQQLTEHMVSARSICFEITETAAVANIDNAISFITSLRERGCRFALDDFGSGMASFSYLKTLPVDYLKISGSFVRTIVKEPLDYALVETINRIGHVMGIKTIGESAEDDMIVDKLRELGVDYAQGYGISRPKPIRSTFTWEETQTRRELGHDPERLG